LELLILKVLVQTFAHSLSFQAISVLHETECNYAQIEKELLAIVFAMERFENYVYGIHVTVESDHKHLEIIYKKSLLKLTI
jgi:hypothetical protein